MAHRQISGETSATAAAPTGEPWLCPSCGVRNLVDVCMCRMVRPMSQKGFPPIFKGMCFHFNGIIPRTLKHPSHSIEWRMAEAHGARCCSELLPDTVTHLVYRPGYERSEKVRAAFRTHKVLVLPIKWMLDSLLQSRQLHESIYRMTEIPLEALPTSNSTVLQHHQHAYFMQNYETFIPPGGVTSNAHVGSAAQQLQSALMNRAEKSMKMIAPPKLEPIPSVVPRTRAADVVRNPGPGARSLLRGHVLFFAGADLAEQAKDAIEAHGGHLTFNAAEATVVIFTSGDKKSDLMLDAVAVNNAKAAAGEEQIPLLSSTWLLDGMYLEALPPPLGPYAATPKLIQTLNKKLAKRG